MKGCPVGQHEPENLPAPQTRKSTPAEIGKSILSFVLMLAAVFAFVWLMKTFVYQAYNIPTGSMENTIMPGDMVFAEKISFRFGEPEAGDIVTFQDPRSTDDRILIKRVIATAGQVVEIIDGGVVVDGVRLEEPYVIGTTGPLATYDVSYPYTVPEGHVWVMGDNRQNSTDSRAFGAIPLSLVKERAVFIYWPFNHFGSLYK